MKKICGFLCLFILSSSCANGSRGNYQSNPGEEEGTLKGYQGDDYPSGDSYYKDSARNPKKDEPRSNWRLW